MSERWRIALGKRSGAAQRAVCGVDGQVAWGAVAGHDPVGPRVGAVGWLVVTSLGLARQAGCGARLGRASRIWDTEVSKAKHLLSVLCGCRLPRPCLQE